MSDEMGHKSSTVLTFIDEIMPLIRDIDSAVSRIHNWSDSPASQYRNKHIFDLIANHEQTYKIPAWWNYFEAVHGKGPCDGLGGTCKRLEWSYEKRKSNYLRRDGILWLGNTVKHELRHVSVCIFWSLHGNWRGTGNEKAEIH